jgi:hypothetical protein
MIRQALLTSILAGALTLALAGDMPERGRELMRLAPELDPQLAGHLVRDTEEEFRAYCREIGPMRTFEAMALLNLSVRSDSPKAYERTMRRLYPHVRRAADAMSYEFKRPEYARIYQFRASLAESSWAYAWAHRQCINAFDTLQWNTTIPRSEKLEGYRDLANRFASFGDERELMNIDAVLAGEFREDENFELRVRLLRSALARARRLCEYHMVCQLLGDMGDAHRRLGHWDSAVAAYREGIEVADSRFVPDQAARLRLFLAKSYFDQGRLAVSSALMQEALGVNRHHGGDPLDIRTLIQATEYYALLQCWDMVDRNLERFPALLRALRHSKHDYEAGQYELTVGRLRAQALAGKGKASAAADSLHQLLQIARDRAKPELIVRIMRHRAEALLRAGRTRDALAMAQEGAALADRMVYNAERWNLGLVLMRAALGVHELEVARAELELLIGMVHDRQGFGQEPDHVVDGIAARIAMAAGDRRTAERLVRRGFRSLRDSIRVLDRDPSNDLMVMAADDLWLAGHSLVEGTSEAGLAFERHWRSLVGGPGVATAAAGPGDLRIPPRTVHLVYAVMPPGIVRWTASSAGVRRDILQLHPDSCRVLVERIFEQASGDPRSSDTPMPPALIALARRMGHVLLPDPVRLGAYDQVAIAADGPLGRLPFELLDASNGGDYLPLLARAEVRYLRHVRPRSPRGGAEQSVILADSGAVSSPNGRRTRLSRLTAVQTEVERARRILPNPRVVHGSALSKRSLLAAWARSSTIYVAAHLVRDPDAPLFNYFPIAFGGAGGLSADHYIDIRDVRDTDLRRCGLVVLSSCASGEAYIAGTHSGPSMADAFLDAGAEAVIHTRWRVRDESAATTAPRLAGAWLQAKRGGGEDWLATRRHLIRGPRGIRHPFEWAAWSVTTALPVPDWTGTAGAVSDSRSRPIPPPPVARAALPARAR